MLKTCGHGKLLDDQCLACAMMWRIEQRKDTEIAHLRARVQELEATMIDDIWLSDDPVEVAAKYPYYAETMHRLEAILDLAQLRGVTGPEIASMMASLHARAVARLHPNEQQREHVIEVFRHALITIQNDLKNNADIT
jgi:hypothetical protein